MGNTPPTVCYEYSYPDGNCNLNSSGGGAFDQHHYEQPMVVFPTSQSPADSIGKPTTTSRSSESGSCTTASSQQQQQQQLLLQQQQQPQQQERGCTIPSSGSPMSSGGTFERQGTNSSGSNNNNSNRVNGNAANNGNIPIITSTPLPPTPTSPGRVPLPPTTAPPPPPPPQPAPPPLAPSSTVDPKFTTWATVNTNGARVAVPDCGVFLTVPPGALSPGQAADVFLSVLSSSPPPLSPGETLLSPVVICGPREASTRLKKPVTVTLPHSASLRHGNWSVSLRRNDRALVAGQQQQQQDKSSWQKVVTLGQETLNTPVYAQLDLNACHVMTDQLTCLALVGESARPDAAPATKSLRLAAFAQERPAASATSPSSSSSSSDLTVRVYLLPDTDAALASAAEQERRVFDGRLLDRPTAVLVRDGGGDIRIKMEMAAGGGGGWACREGADYLEVPMAHVWGSTSNPALHCSFTLRPTNRSMGNNANSNTNTNGSVHSHHSRSSGHSSGSSGSSSTNNNNSNGNSSKLNFTLVVSQDNSNATLMHVECDLSRRGLPGLLLPHYEQHQQHQHMTTSSRFRLSQALLSTLSGLLDPPNPRGNDWRMLAERLNVHRYPAYFATRPSPTEAILALWEARNRELLAVSNLGNVLRGMGRFDAAGVLERDGAGGAGVGMDLVNGNGPLR